MGEENALLRDGKEAMPQRLIGQDVVDAQIDMVVHASARAEVLRRLRKKPAQMDGSATRPDSLDDSGFRDLELLALDLRPVFLGEEAARGLGLRVRRASASTS